METRVIFFFSEFVEFCGFEVLHVAECVTVPVAMRKAAERRRLVAVPDGVWARVQEESSRQGRAICAVVTAALVRYCSEEAGIDKGGVNAGITEKRPRRNLSVSRAERGDVREITGVSEGLRAGDSGVSTGGAGPDGGDSARTGRGDDGERGGGVTREVLSQGPVSHVGAGTYVKDPTKQAGPVSHVGGGVGASQPRTAAQDDQRIDLVTRVLDEKLF